MSLFSHLTGNRYFGVVGDSKTGTYAASLMMLLEGHTGNIWSLSLNHATAGWTLANAMTGIDAAITAVTNPPEFVCVGLGTNEANDSPLPDETTWIANYGSLADQIHAEWPDIPMFVCQVWRGDSSGAWLDNCATLNTRIATVVAARSSWMSIAHSEFDWLDAVSLDKVHPAYHTSGGAEQARRWWPAVHPLL